MHEYSICRSLLNAVLNELAERGLSGKRLVKATMVVGALRSIVPEYMEDAYHLLSKGTPVEGSALEITSKPVRGLCRDCGWSGPFDKEGFRCGRCGSSNAEMESGMELYLANLEIEED